MGFLTPEVTCVGGEPGERLAQRFGTACAERGEGVAHDRAGLRVRDDGSHADRVEVELGELAEAAGPGLLEPPHGADLVPAIGAREVLVLRDYQDLASAEIASTLKIPMTYSWQTFAMHLKSTWEMKTSIPTCFPANCT